MIAQTTRLRKMLRDVPFARAVTVRVRTLGLSRGGAENGVLVLCYHGMRASDRGRFEAQIRQLRDLAEIVGPGDVLDLVGRPRIEGRFVCLTFDDGYRDAFDHALPILVEQRVPAAFFIVSGWIDQNRPGVINWAECRRLLANGMRVGSHSVTHPHLARLDEAAARTELTASRARLEAELGVPCVHFACPYGQPGEDYRADRDPGLARLAGYQSFFTTIPGRAHAGTDQWTLPRVRMEPGWGAAELRYAFSR